MMYANGMGVSFHSEPHVLAGTITPTIGRCNISLPMENGLNSIEWRLRKEQIKGKVTIFGRKLRVSRSILALPQTWRGTGPFLTLQRGMLGLQNTFRPSERGTCLPLGLRKTPPFPDRWAAIPVVNSRGASAGDGIGLHFTPAISLSCHYLGNATHESGLLSVGCLVSF